MKTLEEIVNFIENLKNEYNKQLKNGMWHVSLSTSGTGTNITFFIDTKKETKKMRSDIKQQLGEPSDVHFWENTKYNDYITYEYNLES